MKAAGLFYLRMIPQSIENRSSLRKLHKQADRRHVLPTPFALRLQFRYNVTAQRPLDVDLLGIFLFRQRRLLPCHGKALGTPCRAFDRSSASLSHRPHRRTNTADPGQVIDKSALRLGRPPLRWRLGCQVVKAGMGTPPGMYSGSGTSSGETLSGGLG